jgi:hypothetical protein
MPKNPFKTLPVFFLLFLIFCFSLFPSSAKAACWCSCNNGDLGNVNDSTVCSGSCIEMGGMKGCYTSANPTNPTTPSGPVQFVPQVPIPGYAFDASDSSTRNIANYVKAIYKYLIGIVGIVAAIMLMVGGVVWLTAGGSPERVKQAQDYIVGSLTGLALALGSFLGMINPALVNFRISGINTVTSPTADQTKFEGKTTCGTGSHLGWGQQPYAYNGFTVNLEICTCISGDGANECDSTGQQKNCKQTGSCGTWPVAKQADAQCCAQCCSKMCKQGGCLMGVCQAICQ